MPLRMGHFFAHAVAQKAHKSGILDIKKGFAMLRSREVAILAKLSSLAIGALLTFLLVALEIPLEGVIALFVFPIGPILDFAVDGVEFIILPLVFAAALLPHLARNARPVLAHAAEQCALPK
jgi:hypothetical protein